MNILHGFEGILQVDGYTGYDALAKIAARASSGNWLNTLLAGS